MSSVLRKRCCCHECDCGLFQDTHCEQSGKSFYRCCYRTAGGCNCVCDKPVSWYFFCREQAKTFGDVVRDWQIELIQRELLPTDVYDHGNGDIPVECLALFMGRYLLLPVTATLINHVTGCNETIENAIVKLEPVGPEIKSGDPTPQLLWRGIGDASSPQMQPFFISRSEGGCWDEYYYRMRWFSTLCPSGPNGECGNPDCETDEDLREGQDTCDASNQAVNFRCTDIGGWVFSRQFIQHVQLTSDCADCIDTGTKCNCP